MSSRSHDEDIRLLALHNSYFKTSEYGERLLCRWYSKEFHTPLPEVEKLDTSYILLHYWECHYADIEEERLNYDAVILTETQEEKVERLRKEEEEKKVEQMFLKQAEEEAKRIKEKKPQNVSDLKMPTTKLSNKIPETDFNKIKDVKPIISFKQVESDELEKLIKSIDGENAAKKR